MLPLNPLISLTPLRTQRGVLRLAEMIWSDARPLRVEATALGFLEQVAEKWDLAVVDPPTILAQVPLET